jgi:hypothetical protein
MQRAGMNDRVDAEIVQRGAHEFRIDDRASHSGGRGRHRIDPDYIVTRSA